MISIAEWSQEESEDADIRQITMLCKAAGDPVRMQILRALQNNSFGVLELCEVFGIQQPALSHHLKILAKASLVAFRREGTSIFYRRNDINPNPGLRQLQNALFTFLDSNSINNDYATTLAKIHSKRSNVSLEFFNKNVHKFEENQDLIAGWSDYGPSIEGFMPTSGNRGSALDVGAGYGNFIKILASTFDTVVALDNSQEMLAKCKNEVEAQNIDNVEFILGDTKKVLESEHHYDFISLNMVLHHNLTPSDLVNDCAKVLHNKGTLLVTELCDHDQRWVRNTCGDTWLGIEPNALTKWAVDAGLEENASLYLSMRNGFRIQIRRFSLKQP